MKKWLYLFLVLVATLNGQIKIKPVDSYGLKKVGRNTYVLKLNDSRQTLVRLTGFVEDKGYHRVVWKTDKSIGGVMDLPRISSNLSIHIHTRNTMVR